MTKETAWLAFQLLLVRYGASVNEQTKREEPKLKLVKDND